VRRCRTRDRLLRAGGRAQPLLGQQRIAASSACRWAARGRTQIDGELSFDFDKKGQCVLSASQLRHHRIENIGHVCDRIVRFHELGKWRPDWVLIDQVWTAEFLTVAVAQSTKATLGLTMRVDTAPGLVALSDASLPVEISSKSGEILYVRGANQSPFFSGRKLRRRLFADNDTKQISTGGGPSRWTRVHRSLGGWAHPTHPRPASPATRRPTNPSINGA
jgi:hypothetical protein